MDYRFDSIVLAVAGHYRLLKTIVTSNDYPRALTESEAKTADSLTDIISSVAGRGLSSYCADKFQHGWLSGDLRSYKIKFVMLKLKSIVRDKDALKELNERMDDLIELGEYIAGCIPDNKRRNKAAREERSRISASRKSKKMVQMDLFREEKDKVKEDSSVDYTYVEDAYDDIGLSVVLSSSIRSSRNNVRERNDNESVKSESRKSSKRKGRLDRMAEEIISAEYRTSDYDGDEYDRGDAEDNEATDIDDIDESYGTHYGMSCQTDDYTGEKEDI